jgi:mono/diheme cytochrome c family protein
MVAAGSAVALADDSRASGAYLTGGAGQCSDCHGAGLKGGPNPIPGPPGAPWAKTVPNLRGLKMFPTDAVAIAFLHTTLLPGGVHALGPMPRYKFSVADATAIVTYLRSLK